MSDQPTPEIRDLFLEGMSHAACTVNIITTDGIAGRAGVTVSAMSSVSADTPKPTLLVCIHHQSPTAQKIIDNGVFCVNVLRDDQAYVSDTFAGRFKDVMKDKFDCAEWTAMPSGAPRVVDPLVGFDCRLISTNLVGTHHVFFGEVLDIFVARRGSPLIYANRAYGSTSRIDYTQPAAARRKNGSRSLSIGCFHTFGPYFLPAIIQELVTEDSAQAINLVEGDQHKVLDSLQAGNVELALLYDIDLPDNVAVKALTKLSPYVLITEGHPLAEHTTLTPAKLADYPMVLLDAPPSGDYFTRILAESGITPQIAYRSSSFEMVRGLVGHGLGYTLLATKPASPMTYDGRALISRQLIADTEPSQVALVWRRNIELSKPAQDFKQSCEMYFSKFEPA